MNIDKDIIRSFTKLRISNHRLEVEIGRYSKTPLSERICKCCDSDKIEDEIHFLCFCSLYCDYRKELYDNISNIVPMFETLTDIDKFTFLMGCKECDILSLILNYVFKCFNLRSSRTS